MPVYTTVKLSLDMLSQVVSMTYSRCMRITVIYYYYLLLFIIYLP